MKKAFTHEYFIIRRKQHNLGSPDTCLVLDDFLLPSCSSHLLLMSLSLAPSLQQGGRGETPSPLGQSPATALTPHMGPTATASHPAWGRAQSLGPPCPVEGGTGQERAASARVPTSVCLQWLQKRVLKGDI